MEEAVQDIRSIVLRATTDRPYKGLINEETKEALAAYFAGQQLYPYIYPFSRIENQEKLGWRRFQTVKHYKNFVKKIARQYLEGVYRQASQITRKYNDESFDEYLSGDYDEWFRKEVAIYSLILPELYVIVAKPGMNTIEVITKEDEEDLGLEPYPVIAFPNYVKNYEINRNGDIVWISFQKPGDGLQNSTSILLYTDTEFIELENVSQDTDSVNYQIKSRINHGFSECPVVRIAWSENTSYEGTPAVGHAFLKEVIDLSLANLQYISMLVEMGYFHLSYKIVMGEETAKRTIESGIGNQTAIVEEAEEKGTTRYLELPRMEIAELKDIVYEKNPASIHDAARLVDRSVAKAQSGVAKTIDLAPETAALYEVAALWQCADEKITYLLAIGYFGQEKADTLYNDATLQYPSSFEVRSPQEIISDLTLLANTLTTNQLPTSEFGIKALTKFAYHGILPWLNAEDLAKVDEQIDSAVLQIGTPVQKQLPPAPVSESVDTGIETKSTGMDGGGNKMAGDI